MHKVVKIATSCFGVEPRHTTGMPRATVEVRKQDCEFLDSPLTGGGVPASWSPGGTLRPPGQRVAAARLPPTLVHLRRLLSFPGAFSPVVGEKDQRDPSRAAPPTQPRLRVSLPHACTWTKTPPLTPSLTDAVTWWGLGVTGSIWAFI